MAAPEPFGVALHARTGKIVEDADPPSFPGQPVHQVAPHETRAAGDQGPPLAAVTRTVGMLTHCAAHGFPPDVKGSGRGTPAHPGARTRDRPPAAVAATPPAPASPPRSRPGARIP